MILPFVVTLGVTHVEGTRFSVRIAAPGVPGAHGVAAFEAREEAPLGGATWGEALAIYARYPDEVPASLLREVGRELHRALFEGPRSARSWGAILQAASGRPLHLRVLLGPDTALFERLPLELLHDGETFLLRRPGYDLCWVVEEIAPRQARAEPPRSILIACALPADEIADPSSPGGRSVAAVRAATPRVEVIAGATLASVTARLQRARRRGRPFEGLYLLAHGGVDRLELPEVEGSEAPISALRLGEAFRGSGVWFAFLCACEARAVDGGASFASVARQLMADSGGGLERVIAPQARAPIAQSAAFTEAFFGALGDGLAVATSAARRSLPAGISSPDGAFEDGSWGVFSVLAAPTAPPAVPAPRSSPWRPGRLLLLAGLALIEGGDLAEAVELGAWNALASIAAVEASPPADEPVRILLLGGAIDPEGDSGADAGCAIAARLRACAAQQPAAIALDLALDQPAGRHPAVRSALTEAATSGVEVIWGTRGAARELIPLAIDATCGSTTPAAPPEAPRGAAAELSFGFARAAGQPAVVAVRLEPEAEGAGSGAAAPRALLAWEIARRLADRRGDPPPLALSMSGRLRGVLDPQPWMSLPTASLAGWESENPADICASDRVVIATWSSWGDGSMLRDPALRDPSRRVERAARRLAPVHRAGPTGPALVPGPRLQAALVGDLLGESAPIPIAHALSAALLAEPARTDLATPAPWHRRAPIGGALGVAVVASLLGAWSAAVESLRRRAGRRRGAGPAVGLVGAGLGVGASVLAARWGILLPLTAMMLVLAEVLWSWRSR